MTTVKVYAQSKEGSGRVDMYEFKTEEEWQTFERVMELEPFPFSTSNNEFYSDMFGGTWCCKRYRNVEGVKA